MEKYLSKVKELAFEMYMVCRCNKENLIPHSLHFGIFSQRCTNRYTKYGRDSKLLLGREIKFQNDCMYP